MNPQRLVLGTNVLASGVLSAHGPPGRIVDMVATARLQLMVDSRVLAEYDEVLRWPELRLQSGTVDRLLDAVRTHSLLMIVPPWEKELPDPDDEPFLALAFAGCCPLVTGNERHYPCRLRRGVSVLSPRDYFDAYRIGR